MKFVRLLLLALLAGLAFGAAAAWPEKPIKLIVPYPPGGLTEAVARQVGAALAEGLKQPVVIENVAGGGGNIGADLAPVSIVAESQTVLVVHLSGPAKRVAELVLHVKMDQGGSSSSSASPGMRPVS